MFITVGIRMEYQWQNLMGNIFLLLNSYNTTGYWLGMRSLLVDPLYMETDIFSFTATFSTSHSMSLPCARLLTSLIEFCRRQQPTLIQIAAPDVKHISYLKSDAFKNFSGTETVMSCLLSPKSK